jgi:hypothetical protein
MEIVCPVIQEQRGEHKKTIMPATSEVSPSRLIV